MSEIVDPLVVEAQRDGWCCYAGAVAFPRECPWHPSDRWLERQETDSE